MASDRSQLSSALSTLATNYNAVVDQLDAQMGSNAGMLSGDYSIRAVQDDMRQLTTYSASNNMNLSILGVTFDDTGHMSFDPTAVNSLSDTQLSSAFSYLGSSTKGFGALASQFTQLSDPISGAITTEENGLDAENTRIANQINDLQARVLLAHTALMQQLQQADAAVANLQSQQQVLTASVQSVDLALYGKNWGTAISGG